MSRRRLVLVCLLVLSGCSGSGDSYTVAPVSGTVTLNGKPLAQVDVLFQPVADATNNPGPGSAGVTDEAGRYTLKLIGKDSRGAVVGKHKVRFSNHVEPFDPDVDKEKAQVKPATPLPAKYAHGLDFEVPRGGTNSADFQLTK